MLSEQGELLEPYSIPRKVKIKQLDTPVSGKVCGECYSTEIHMYQSDYNSEPKFLMCDRCHSLNIKDGCPNCGSVHIYDDPHRAEAVCLDCGWVLAGSPPLSAGSARVEYPWGFYSRGLI